MADYMRVHADALPLPHGGSIQNILTSCSKDIVPVREAGSDMVETSMPESLRHRFNCRTCLPPARPATEYKRTLKQLGVISWPVVLYMISALFLSATTIIFSGHLGKDEIAASSLGQSVISYLGFLDVGKKLIFSQIVHVCWRAILYGYSSGADTMLAQTYGSKNKKRVGIILQRFLVMSFLLAIFSSGLLFNTEAILLVCKQDPKIARLFDHGVQLAAGYGMVFMAATPADAVVCLLIKYLECQSIVRPILVVVILMAIFNILLHFITVSALQLGMLGAVGAQVMAYYLGAAIMLGYIYAKKLHKETWPGWSWECLQEWGTILKLSAAGLGTTCVEWTVFEAGFFIAGLKGTTEIGAHAVLFYACSITWSISAGIGIGGAILIGNHLGGNDPVRAHMTAICCVSVAAILGVLYIAFYLPPKNVLGYIFTSDVDVVRLVSEVLPIVALSEVWDSGSSACYGVLRGCGYQFVGAIVCVTSYLVSLPVGISLMFKYDYGLKGLWIGLLMSLASSFIIMVIFIFCFINWDREALKAQRRAAVVPSSETEKLELNEGIQLKQITGAREVKAEIGEASPLKKGKIEGNTDQRHENRNNLSKHDRQIGGEDVGESRSVPMDDHAAFSRDGAETETRIEGGCVSDEKYDGDKHIDNKIEEEEKIVTVLTLDRLSWTQIVIRRGLLLIFLVLFFIASVIVCLWIVPRVRPAIPDLVNSTVSSNITIAEYMY